ncbi:MAG: 4Fe-4S dicluster domain-containing protein [Terriglobales bacterium]
MSKVGPARGNILIDTEECKGCGLCVESCPPECLELLPELNAYGVHPAHYTGEGCSGCGICFYCCPEPGAITVYRLAPPSKPLVHGETQEKVQGESHAAAL